MNSRCKITVNNYINYSGQTSNMFLNFKVKVKIAATQEQENLQITDGLTAK